MTSHQEPAVAMKLFHLPDGLQVWNSPQSGTDTQALYGEIFRQGVYEREILTIRDGDVVFDLGANIGLFGLYLMRKFRDLRLYCFEPVPGTYDCLERNLAESPNRSGHQVTTLKLAVGARDAETTIEYFPGAPSNSTLYSEEKHRDFPKVLDSVRWIDVWRRRGLRALPLLPLFPFRKRLLTPAFERLMAQGVSIPCRVRTLSSVIDEYSIEQIDLLKVDVEGAEMDVLAGLEDRHWRIVRQLCMEIEPANKPDVRAFVARLRSLGFTRIEIESMFGGPSDLQDSIACVVYAVRPG